MYINICVSCTYTVGNKMTIVFSSSFLFAESKLCRFFRPRVNFFLFDYNFIYLQLIFRTSICVV